MTQRFVVPYLRATPIHIPRRDLVLGAGDSLSLEVAIIQWDNPSSPALDVTGGIGGPVLTLFIWPAGCWPRSWDYGAPCMTPGSPLWSGDGTISTCGPGTFVIAFPPGTMARFPPRCGWSMQLMWEHDTQASVLAGGNLHVMPSGQRAASPSVAIITSGNAMMKTNSGGPVLATGSGSMQPPPSEPSVTPPFDPSSLPTTLPGLPGVLWNNGGVVCIS